MKRSKKWLFFFYFSKLLLSSLFGFGLLASLSIHFTKVGQVAQPPYLYYAVLIAGFLYVLSVILYALKIKFYRLIPIIIAIALLCPLFETIIFIALSYFKDVM
ncbi:hypothetical protein [Sporolactobacillus terrae]|uniref:Uncharacterized protein n=1 Tax=Sporolactobacillus terrae TaxID=269673 RepID=A0A5K7X046_9BACL|nr:hypothetical protein [Sporolactobacillus terrae]BBN98070.1 hypothetical protein St703_07750 [Sporolactobacillus terrae]